MIFSKTDCCTTHYSNYCIFAKKSKFAFERIKSVQKSFIGWQSEVEISRRQSSYIVIQVSGYLLRIIVVLYFRKGQMRSFCLPSGRIAPSTVKTPRTRKKDMRTGSNNVSGFVRECNSFLVETCMCLQIRTRKYFVSFKKCVHPTIFEEAPTDFKKNPSQIVKQENSEVFGRVYIATAKGGGSF